jgi:uncharacterized Zn-finger protein
MTVLATLTDAQLQVKKHHEPLAHPGTGATCAEKRYEVTRAELPLSCPTPGMALWNAHPRVYLPIVDDGGETVCPYCAARYVLKD